MSTKLAGPLNVNNQKVTNVPDPINALDAVNLQTLQNATSTNLTYIAGENINSHTPVVLINNLLYKCDITNSSHQFSYIGFTKNSVISGASVEVVTEGVISLSGWGLTTDSYYQLNINSTISLTEPTLGLFKQVVGFSQTSNDLLLLRTIPILK